MTVVCFVCNQTKSHKFCGLEFMLSGAENELQTLLASSTLMFSVDIVSSKQAKVNGVLCMTKGQAWQAMDRPNGV